MEGEKAEISRLITGEGCRTRKAEERTFESNHTKRSPLSRKIVRARGPAYPMGDFQI